MRVNLNFYPPSNNYQKVLTIGPKIVTYNPIIITIEEAEDMYVWSESRDVR